MNFDTLAIRREEWCQLGKCWTLSGRLILHFEENAQAVELVGGERDFIIVDVCRYKAQKQLEIRLDEVQDDLVVVVLSSEF